MELIDNILSYVKDLMQGLVRTGEEQVMIAFYRIKRRIFKFVLELVMFTVGLVFLLVGIVLLLGKILPIEWMLVLVGLILLNIVLIITKFH
jgi:hypothetical protein